MIRIIPLGHTTACLRMRRIPPCLGRILLGGLVLSASSVSRASAQEVRASVTGGVGDSARRVTVTAEHLRTAFRDPFARAILIGARVARLQLDSGLISYDARGYQRVSVNLAVSALGRDRLAYRSEGATHVKWHRDVGAHVEIEGARAVAPIVAGRRSRSDTAQNAPRGVASDIQLPYFPGSESLWIGSDVAATDVDPRSLIHPLAAGSEAYYRYARGDSAQYTMPDRSRVNLVELLITPREAKWNLVVGSFWFDEANYRLVKAAYRLAVPLDVWTITIDEGDADDGGVGLAIARAFVNPVRGTVSAVTVEYALYEQRFWLPRVRTAEGMAQIAFARVPFGLEQKFDYLSVNGDVNLPPIPLTPAMARADSFMLRDSLAKLVDPAAHERARLITARLDSADLSLLPGSELGRRAGRGDSAAAREMRERVERRRNAGNVCDTARAITTYSRTDNRATRIMTTATCNDSLLINSPQLPPSIYTPSDSLLGPSDRDRMRDELTMGLQSQLSPQRPVLEYGLGDGMMRYNRVEGFSPALRLRQTLGSGLSVSAEARMGTADKELNGELGISRTDGRRTMRISGYRRLIASNDWGNPLSFGSSFQALVFGRDEGFYYRGTGAELVLSGQKTPYLEWRLFGERQSTALVETDFSVANAIDDRQFAANIVADEGDVFGAGFRLMHSWGENPDGLRGGVNLKGENGMGDFSFGRGMFDASLSQGIVRKIGVTLSVSAGSSVGTLPVQRQFSVGGTQSVRGQRAGTQFGDAFWMSRAEVGSANVGARRVFFADFGWAGSREDWGRQSRAISGVGVGWSFLDGLIRMDLARGIHPGKVWRFASYFEARL